MKSGNLLRSASLPEGVIALAEKLKKREGRFTVRGWAGSGQACAMAGLFQLIQKTIIVITPTDQAAQELKDDLVSFLDEDRVKLFPSWETEPLAAKVPEPEVISERMEALAALLTNQPVLVVVPVEALYQETLLPSQLKESSIALNVGEEYELDRIAQTLQGLGFKRASWVEEVGDYSRRGGIVDIF